MFRKKIKQEKQFVEDWITFEENGGNPTLKLSGELGFFAMQLLEDTLRKFLLSHKNTSLGVDLSAVSAIIDSRIVNIFIQAYHRAERRKIQFKLIKANNAVRHAFESVNVSESLFDE